MIYVMSGGTKLFAAIGVTYPEGSILTCTKGSKTLRAKTSTGQWVFSIPEAGDWTVTATDGTNTRSQTVSITAEGQGVSMILNYELALLSSSGLASGYSLKVMNGADASISNNQIVFAGTVSSGHNRIYLSPAVDCSQYTKLTVKGRRTSGGSVASNFTVGVAASLPGTSADNSFDFAASTDISLGTEAETVTVDLSNVNTTCYFAASTFYLSPGFIESIVFS